MNVDKIFSYQQPDEEQVKIIEDVRENCKQLCNILLDFNQAKEKLEELVRSRLPENEHKDIGLSMLWNLEPGEESDVIIETHKLNMMLNASVVLGEE
jgi:hypothetical protein